MAFCFNWDAMDDSFAEIVRLLVNEKLDSVLKERFSPATRTPLSPGPSFLASAMAAGGTECLHPPINTGGVGGGAYRGPSTHDSASTSLSVLPGGAGAGLPMVGPAPHLAGAGSHGAALPASAGVPVTAVGAVAGGNVTGVSGFSTGPAPAVAAASGLGPSAASAAHLPRGSGPNNNLNISTGTGTSHVNHDSRLPPIRELYVDGIEWGVAAPFVEVVTIADAIPFDDADDGRDVSATTLGEELDRVRQGTDSPFDSLPPRRHPSASGVPHGSSATTAADNDDHTTASSHVAAGSETVHQRPSAPATPLRDVAPPVGPPTPPAETGDGGRLASLLGPQGLFVRLHITYGGSMALSIKTVVQHELRAGPISLPVSMPLNIRAGDVDLDCFVCLNITGAESRLWLEPGKLSASPLNRLNLTVVFGTDRSRTRGAAPGQHRHEDDSLDGASAFSESLEDTYRDYDSSSVEAVDDDESVYVDESAVASFVLRELKAILQEKLVAPHYIRLPIRL